MTHTTAIASVNSHPWHLSPTDFKTRISHCAPENQRALAWCYQYAADNNLSVSTFAERADFAASTLTKILSGTYINPRDRKEIYDIPDNMAQSIQAFQATVAATMPSQVIFTSTDTARKIFFNCNLARESRSPVFLMGASHIGKTTALEQYRDANPGNTYLITITSGMGAKGVAVAIAEECGVSSSGSLSTITRRLRKSLTRDKLIILDDFHVLTLSASPRGFLGAMEFLRALYDADNCGMIFSTTDIDYDKIVKNNNDSLHQLLRRGIHRPHLGKMPLKKDVKAILAAHGLPWPAKSHSVQVADTHYKPAALIQELAITSGLKVITERLRYALKLAARDASPVTWQHFCHAQTMVALNQSAPANDWND